MNAHKMSALKTNNLSKVILIKNGIEFSKTFAKRSSVK